MTKWETHLLEATKEPDGVTPSSARIYALWLIAFVLLAQFLIVDCLVWKLLTLDASSPNAIGLANVYASVLRVFMLWSMLFDVATALSLYGINVWKYISTFASPLAGILPTGTGVVTRQDLDGNQKTVTLVNEDTTESSRCD